MSMSLDDLSDKLTSSIKAVIVYHVAGYPSDAERIAKLCRDQEITLIEDCNNAIGATINDRTVGLFGDYAVYSLYPNRQINGINGGMLATPDAASKSRATRLRHYGIDYMSFRDLRGEISSSSDIPEIGWCSTLNNLNAAVALSQLSTLAKRLSSTPSNAARLACELSGLSTLRPVHVNPGMSSAYWGFLLLSEHRDELLTYLRDNEIKSSILHHRNDSYTGFGTPTADLPGTQLVLDQLLAIPCGWWLSEPEVSELICKIKEFSIIEF